MLRGALISFAALLFFLSMEACGTAGAKTIQISEGDFEKDFQLEVGDILEVVLQGNPTTGYVWEIEALKAEILRSMGDYEFKQDREARGAGGVIRMRLQAVGPGSTPLKLIYHRPFEKGRSPVKMFQVHIFVN